MKRDVVLEIGSKAVDLLPGTSLTLNFNSSLLGDIGSLKCDVSQTVSLPRTAANDRIFSMALMPSYEGVAARRVLPCRCYVDGVTIFDNGLCHLTDSGDDRYEVVMTWGLLHGNSDFLVDKRKLTELTDYDEDYITWNSNSGVSVTEGGVSKIESSPSGATASMFYKDYVYLSNSLVDRRLVNLHPCVSLLEIWERIRLENNINIALDDLIREDMERRFIVLQDNNKQLQDYTAPLTINGTPAMIVPNLYDSTNPDKKSLIFGFSGLNVDRYYDRYIFKPYGDGSTAVKIQNIKVQYEDDNFIRAVKARPQDYALEIRRNGIPESVNPVVEGYVLSYNINTNVTDGVYRFSSSLSLSMKITRWDEISDNDWYNRLATILVNDFYVWSDSTINVMYQLNAAGYPLAQFRLTPNLPPISQIDFINFICNWYGLFPVMDSGMVRLVSFSVLTDNIENGKIYDWSDKLVSYSDDTPKSIAYAMDYAQHNSVGYTVDDNDAMRVTDVAYIDVNDKTLDRDGELVKFPFAATYKNLILQYRLTADGKVERIDWEYRLMGLDEDGRLNFNDDMKSSYIVKTLYPPIQGILSNPVVIEDDFLLDLMDLRSLDYTKPVYIAKYGRYFAIESIRWSSNDKVCNVKLIMIR